MTRRYKRKPRRANWRVGAAVAALCALALCAVAGVWLAERFTNRPAAESYPVRYEQSIRQIALEFDLPPAYVAAVILAESSYDPEAVSYADARGLMQLLPSTAEWIAGKLGERYDEASLFDPETNIRYGCWYLAFLMNRYDGDMMCSSAAYHAGQGTVDKWLGDERYSGDGETLQAIASAATNTYVSRVLKNYEKYCEIYAALS